LIRAGDRVCARRQAATVTTLGFQFAAHDTEPVRLATQEPAERASSVAELTEWPLSEVGRISLSLCSGFLITPLQNCFGSDLHFGCLSFSPHLV
jgi:hypothetical protein